MSVAMVLYIIAVCIFVLAAFGVTVGTVTLVPLGLAAFAAAHIA